MSVSEIKIILPANIITTDHVLAAVVAARGIKALKICNTTIVRTDDHMLFGVAINDSRNYYVLDIPDDCPAWMRARLIERLTRGGAAHLNSAFGRVWAAYGQFFCEARELVGMNPGIGDNAKMMRRANPLIDALHLAINLGPQDEKVTERFSQFGETGDALLRELVDLSPVTYDEQMFHSKVQQIDCLLIEALRPLGIANPDWFAPRKSSSPQLNWSSDEQTLGLGGAFVLNQSTPESAEAWLRPIGAPIPARTLLEREPQIIRPDGCNGLSDEGYEID